jgi:hypothetical protein
MNSPDPSGSKTEHWTRHEVAEYLRVSITTVRRMEGRELHPGVGERGVRLFAASEVRTVAEQRTHLPISKREDEGEVAARVFELFRAGADIRKVVIDVRVHPRVVRELYAEWLVSLNDGERRRRQALLDAEDRRKLAREEREHKQWMRTLEEPRRARPGLGK